MGTIGTGRPRALVASALTTGDAVTVQRTLASLRADGAGSVAMEVSSHAIDQARVGAVRFRTVAFTNLTRDHIDYHGTMENYGATKARLFTREELVSRVINVDDPFGRVLARDPRGRGRLIVTGRGHQTHARAAAGFVRAMHVELSTRGIELEFDSSWGPGALTSGLIGDFNVDNLLTVIAILLDWELTPEQVSHSLTRVHAAPGRMETFGGGRAPLAVVDYAHTPDALRKALAAARAHCRGRLAVVFGCGGDRDTGKRPLMGEIAAELADDIVITDDNPRTESPETIAAGIVAGIPAGQPFASSTIAGAPSATRWSTPIRATWWSSPARDTRITSSTATNGASSATRRWSRPRCPHASEARHESHARRICAYLQRGAAGRRSRLRRRVHRYALAQGGRTVRRAARPAIQRPTILSRPPRPPVRPARWWSRASTGRAADRGARHAGGPQQGAAAWRAQFSIPVVGVAGSNGKTTVKEMIAAILSDAGDCWRRAAISTITSACR